KLQLHTKILIGLVLGVTVGLAANLLAVEWLVSTLAALEPLGTAFIRLITMVVVPLVAASLLIGTASLGDLRKLGRIGGKTVVYYMATTAVAVSIGILLSNLVLPGSRIDPETRDRLSANFAGEAEEKMALAAEKPSVVETLLNMIPTNPIKAAAEMDLLPLIVFSILFGAALTLVAKEPRDAVLKVAQGVNDAVMVLIDWIMLLAPYAVFALIAAVVGRFGLDLLRSLLFYALTVVAGLALHAFGTYAFVLRFLVKINPLTFYRRIAKAPLVAFSTSSSNATLPVTMETAEEHVGISPPVASFVLPLGATINMDGTALYQAVATMFIAQIYALPMGLEQQLTIVLTATLASIGAAGVPSAGIIILILVLQSVGIGPAEAAAGIALILGVDRILDMLRTSVNVTGDLTAASFIAKTEGETLEPRRVDHPLKMEKVE
ncbi:MAG TPA: dicarboxylate/amino acid:cation symporter, partial [Thermoanaerobaculia bacterium]|nr:dicarboxylate/amino acid:cation symporter [Thermoanaerobaculia bacterium]